MFKAGDKVRCIRDAGIEHIQKGEVYTVEKVHGSAWLELAELEDRHFLLNRFELITAPRFRVGDKVMAHTDDGPGVISDISNPSKDSDGVTYYRVQFPEGAFWYNPDELQFVERSVVGAPEAPAGQALRYNSDKPESDYIFTYEGGIDACFEASFDYYSTLNALHDLYTGEADPRDLLTTLRNDAADCGDDIIALLADTNAKGGKKYKQGNYLLGANWRQYFQAAVRHAQKIRDGVECDGEGFNHRGNFFFNVLMLCHSVAQGIGTDDRIRAPRTP